MNKLLSIITVTRNCRDLIRGTADSVLTDKPGWLEYVVIDGASDDGTFQVLESYGSAIDLLKSEPDGGIYEAMNKGLRDATGKYVLFLNAGDRLRDASVLPRLGKLLESESPDVLYGDVMLTNAAGRELGLRGEISSRKLPEALTWKSLRLGMVVSHQAFLVRREIAPEFDLRFRSAADIDWVIRCLKGAHTIRNGHLAISDYLTGGYSRQTHGTSLRERLLIFARHYGWPAALIWHLIISLRALKFKIFGKKLY